MSVVVLGHLLVVWRSLLFLPVALLVVLLVGFTRVYSRSRFPHQVVGSWLLGVVGLVASMHCCQRAELHK